MGDIYVAVNREQDVKVMGSTPLRIDLNVLNA